MFPELLVRAGNGRLCCSLIDSDSIPMSMSMLVGVWAFVLEEAGEELFVWVSLGIGWFCKSALVLGETGGA